MGEKKKAQMNPLFDDALSYFFIVSCHARFDSNTVHCLIHEVAKLRSSWNNNTFLLSLSEPFLGTLK